MLRLLPQPDGFHKIPRNFNIPKTNGKYCVVKFSLLAHRGKAIAEQFPLERKNNLQANARNRIKFIKRNLSQSLMCSAKPRKHSSESNSNLRHDECSCRESKAKPSVGGKSLIIEPQIRFSFTYERSSTGGSTVRFVGFAQLSPLRSKLNSQSTHPPCSHHARSHKKRFSSSFF